MKRRLVILTILLLLVIGLVAQAQAPIPKPPANGGYVLDTLGWLSADQVIQVNDKLRKLEQDTTVEIAVVTLDDCGDDHQNFRNELFRNWGIGQKESDNGLLLLVCWCGGDKSRRTFEQEVGYGLEGDVPDLLTSKIAENYFVANFSEGKDVALMATVDAYDAHLRGQELSFPESTDADPAKTLLKILLWIFIIIIAIALLCALLGIDLGSGGGGYSSSSYGGSSSSSSGSSGGFSGGSSGGGGSSTSF